MRRYELDRVLAALKRKEEEVKELRPSHLEVNRLSYAENLSHRMLSRQDYTFAQTTTTTAAPKSTGKQGSSSLQLRQKTKRWLVQRTTKPGGDVFTAQSTKASSAAGSSGTKAREKKGSRILVQPAGEGEIDGVTALLLPNEDSVEVDTTYSQLDLTAFFQGVSRVQDVVEALRLSHSPGPAFQATCVRAGSRAEDVAVMFDLGPLATRTGMNDPSHGSTEWTSLLGLLAASEVIGDGSDAYHAVWTTLVLASSTFRVQRECDYQFHLWLLSMYVGSHRVLHDVIATGHCRRRRPGRGRPHRGGGCDRGVVRGGLEAAD